MSNAQKMLDLFRPKLDAFAICSPSEVIDGDKREAKYFTKKETLTAEHMAAHFTDASQTVTAIPNAESSKCNFGAIDIDIYDDGVLADCVAKIRRWRLPFVMDRSKSGGVHLFWFFPELTDAGLIQDILKQWSKLFDYKCDIIPKSREIRETGNGINLPYAGIEAGSHDRIGYDEHGNPLINPEAWLTLAESRITRLYSPPFADGPPCLQRVTLDGREDQGRNNTLFNVAVYAKLKHGEDDFEDFVDDHNQEFASPLKRSEVTQILQSVARRDYFYNCNDEPCASVCDKTLCKAREFGIGNSRSLETVIDELQERNGEAVLLPSHQFPARDSAARIYERLDTTDRIYLRGDKVSEIHENRIEPIKPQAFRTLIETLGTTYALNVGNQAGQVRPQRRAVSLDHASVILESDVRRYLRKIALVSPVPLLRADGSLMSPGYNDGVFVTGDSEVPVIEYEPALEALLGLLSDFDFVTASDHARAFAMMITPAMRMSKIIDAHVPMDYSEADLSQAGKTLRQAMIRAMYAVRVPLITQKKGGVGSLDESIGSHLFKGYPFLALDNMRGKMDSPQLEMVQTTPDGFTTVRVPHIGSANVDVSRLNVQVSSNGVHMYKDLANRACITRITKKPSGYKFRLDDPLAHVKANQMHYLGCVYAIVRDWIDRGSPMAATASHDMRIWDRTLSEICARAELAEMMLGHFEIKDRVTSPIKGWLRSVAVHLEADQEHTVTALVEISEAHGIELPVRHSARMLQVIGRQLSPLFELDGTCRIDGITILRSERRYENKDDAGVVLGTKMMKLYSRARDDRRDGEQVY